MKSAFDINGYVQGYRFSDDPLYYDSETKRFKDLAGYGDSADLRVTVGSPVFEDVDGSRCVRLDNTFHGLMPSPCPWMGTVVAVIKPVYISGGTLFRYPLMYGDAVSQASNGALRIVHASGYRQVIYYTASAQLMPTQTRTDNNTVVVAFTHDQETRKGYSTSDGVTVSEVTATASTTLGNAVAISSAQYGVRFGNMNGVAGDTTELTDFYANLFELHFFAEASLVDDLPAIKVFMDDLKAKYGIA